MITNSIYFENTSNGPTQVDEVEKYETVSFFCDVPFTIRLKNAANAQFLETAAGNDWAVLSSEDPAEFTQQQESGQDEPHKRYEIRIRMGDLPSGGLAYSVITPTGELDPRVVPPR